MKNYQGSYQVTSKQDFKTVLNFLNNVKTPKEIEEVLKKSKAISNWTELSESIITHRDKLDGFTDIEQLAQISGFDSQEFSTLFSTFEKPILSSEEEETLQHVMWVHGTSLHVENPEVFGKISKKKNGTRLTGLIQFTESDVHYAIPTPTFSSGNRFYIRSIFVIWRTSFLTQTNSPPVWVGDIEIWDGHQQLAINPPFEIIQLNNGYIITKLMLNSNQRINFGIGVSIRQVIESDGNSSNLGWADYASIGVEFVTRNYAGVLTNRVVV